MAASGKGKGRKGRKEDHAWRLAGQTQIGGRHKHARLLARQRLGPDQEIK